MLSPNSLDIQIDTYKYIYIYIPLCPSIPMPPISLLPTTYLLLLIDPSVRQRIRSNEASKMATIMLFAPNAENKMTWAIVQNPMEKQTFNYNLIAPHVSDLKLYGTPSSLACCACYAKQGYTYIYISHCLFDF